MANEQALPCRFGPYVLVRHLGAGSGGSAYLAREFPDGRVPFVVKTLHEELNQNAGALRRFRHEAEIAVLIDDPNVVRVFDAGVVGSTAFFAMEFVAGWSLSKLLFELEKRKQKLPPQAAIELLLGALSGLATLHEAKDPRTQLPLGFVHRDLAPKNMIVSVEGQLTLIDLGLSRSNRKDWLTRPGALLGSMGYMAPEQARAETVDHRADLFSMALILFECVTGDRFFGRGERAEILSLMTSGNLRAEGRGLPRWLEPVVAQAIAAKPDDRFASARAMADALRAVCPPGGKETLLEILESVMMGTVLEEVRTVQATIAPKKVEDSLEEERTVVFASRSSRESRSQDIFGPEIEKPIDSESETRALDTRLTVPSNPRTDPRAVDPAESMGASLTEGRGHPRPRMLAKALVAAGTAIVCASAAIAVGWMRRPPLRPVEEITEAEVIVARTSTLARTPPVTSPPAIEPEPLPPKPEAPLEPRPARAARKKKRNEPARIDAKATEPRRTEFSVDRAIERISQLGTDARKKHPERTREIDRVLGDAMLWSESRDPDRAKSALQELEARIVRLGQ